jgi:hypothetical protein
MVRNWDYTESGAAASVTDADRQIFQTRLDAAVQSLIARRDAAAEAIGISIRELRADLTDRLERVDRRTERSEINTNSIVMQTAGMSKPHTTAEQLAIASAGTLGAIRRTIEELSQRISVLEKKAG